jgi:hypothetical protein
VSKRCDSVGQDHRQKLRADRGLHAPSASSRHSSDGNRLAPKKPPLKIVFSFLKSNLVVRAGARSMLKMMFTLGTWSERFNAAHRTPVAPDKGLRHSPAESSVS